MIQRIVQMQFKPEHLASFVSMFEQKYPQIVAFEGCESVVLWQSTEQPCLVFTYSVWQSAEALARYRDSDFFRSTWASTKLLFAAPAMAHSLHCISPQV